MEGIRGRIEKALEELRKEEQVGEMAATDLIRIASQGKTELTVFPDFLNHSSKQCLLQVPELAAGQRAESRAVAMA